MRFHVVVALLVTLVAALSSAHTVHKRGIGGSEVTNREKYPFMVLLEGHRESFMGIGTSKSWCTGSLLNKCWALSAAHCFTEVTTPNKWHAHLGSLHRYDTWHRILGFFGKVFSVKKWVVERYHLSKIVVHPEFVGRSENWDNDLALIKLDKAASIDASQYVDNILFPEGMETCQSFEGSTCKSIGWGCTENGGTISEEMLEVPMKVLTRQYCLNKWWQLTENQMCAGGDGHGVCAGDSGGPLICETNGGWHQVAITSFAHRSTPASYPSGFTNICPYTDWIKEVIADQSC